MYSKINDEGYYGISKVIFGDGGISNPIIDINGDNGMTEHAMGIQIEDVEEGQNMVNAITSEKFKNIIKDCSFSLYQLYWKIFKEFKRDFWKEFIEHKNTTVIVESGIRNEINLSLSTWLPNSNMEEIKKILANSKEERCPVIYSSSYYHEYRKTHMSHTKDVIFKHTCIHATPKSGTRFIYRNVNDKGHFGISKVIFGESGIYAPVIDINGEYEMTQGAYAIEIRDIEEGNIIIKALQSKKFQEMIKSTMFSFYRIEFNIFKEFKRDFWK